MQANTRLASRHGQTCAIGRGPMHHYWRQQQHITRRSSQLCRAEGDKHSAMQQSPPHLDTPRPMDASDTNDISTSSNSSIHIGTSSNSANYNSSNSPSSWSYGIMTLLAAAGTLETAYLTLSKLLDAAVACPTSGCDTVLNSAYAQLFGLPLPLFGAGTYAAVAAAAFLSQKAASQGRAAPGWVCTGLAAGVAALATTSSYLMYVLQTRLGGAECVWCYGSAALSAALLMLLISSLSKRQLVDAAGPGLGATAAAMLALYVGFGPGQGVTSASELELPYVEPLVTTASSDAAISLARKLKAAGAKMYGAFWCTHCYDQKQEFGVAAMADFPYVECFPQGWKRGVKIADACEAASVKAFPTWLIGGTATEGQLDLAQLEQLLDQATASEAATMATESAEAAMQ